LEGEGGKEITRVKEKRRNQDALVAIRCVTISCRYAHRCDQKGGEEKSLREKEKNRIDSRIDFYRPLFAWYVLGEKKTGGEIFVERTIFAFRKFCPTEGN